MYRKVLLAAMLVSLLLAPAAVAADVEGNDSFTGEVEVKATAPTVSFTLYSDAGYTNPTKEITPQTPVYMKISISGNNPLAEALITVKLFADTNETTVGTPPTTTSPEEYVTFQIYYDGTGWTLIADTGDSTTWSIQLDPNQQQADPQASSGDFYVIITFGKTAREASPSETAPYKDWDIIVDVVIGSAGYTASGSASDYGYTVYFYSEVTVNAGTVSFGVIEAGQTSPIQYVDGNAADSFTATVIANGYYDLKLTSTTTWTNTGDNTITITLTTTEPPGEKQFVLKVDDEEDATNPGYPATPVTVTDDAATASPFVDDAAPTTESGATHTIYMTITLGDNIYTGKYQGTLTLYVVDGG